MRGGSPIHNFSFLSKYKLIISILILFLMIGVVSAANNATVTSDTIPSVMRAGQSYSVSITMKNDGTTIWNETYQYRLGTDGAGDAFKFTTPTGRWLITGSVNPGSSYTFPITMTAPLVNGSGIPVFRMVRDGVEWFGENRTHPVSVSPAGSFTSNVTNGRTPSVGVMFNDTSTNTPTTWAWFFGDESYNQSWVQQNFAGPMNMWNNYVTLPNGIIVEMGGQYGTFYRKEVWISTDQGASWWGDYTPSWSGRSSMSSVALSDGSIVLMGGAPDSSNQLNDTWISTDGGYVWTQQNASSGWLARYGQASVVLSDDSIILMGGHRNSYGSLGDVWRSTDKGVTWTQINASIGYTFQRALAGVLSDGDILLTDGYYVYTSSDKGVTWTLRNSGTGGQARFNPCGVAMPDNSFLMFAGSTGGFPNDVWRTTDKGATWTQINASSGWTGRYGGQGAVALPDGSVLLGASSGLSWYRDTWRFQPVGSTSKNTTHLYTSTVLKKFNVSLQTSNAGGYNNTYKSQYIMIYNQTIAGFISDKISGVMPLLVQFTDQSKNASGLAWFFGDENWTTVPWTQVNASSGWQARYGAPSVIMPDGNIVLMGGGATVAPNYFNDTWKSTNNGTTWTQMTASAGWSSRRDSVAVSLLDGNIVLVGGYEGATGLTMNDTWRSSDQGATWVLMNVSSGWSPRFLFSGVAMPDGSVIITGGESGVSRYNDTWRSTDKGATWVRQNASSGWDPRSYHTSVSLPDGSIVLMGGYSNITANINDVWRSTNNGVTWTRMTASAGWDSRRYQTGVSMFDGSIVLIGGYNNSANGVNDTWRSTDNGTTWTRINTSALFGGNGIPWAASSVAMSDGSIVFTGGYSPSLARNGTYKFQPIGSNAINPSHVYISGGNYSVILQAYNSGMRNSTLNYITVYNSTTSGFSVNNSSGLPSLAVIFNVTVPRDNATQWNWSFGDGAWQNSTILQNATHTYTSVGYYTVTLNASSLYATSTTTRTDYIIVYTNMITDFSANITSGFPPVSVLFNDLSVGATGWAWFFGDESYNQSWNQINVSSGWLPRYVHSSVVLQDGSIVMTGGSNGTRMNDTWRSTNNGATWVQQNASSGWSIRQSHSSVTMPDTSIILMGGYNPTFGYLNDTWRSIDKGVTWTLMNASSGWSARFGFTSIALSDGSVVIMGGSSSTTDNNDVWRSINNGATWVRQNASSGWSTRTELTSVAMLDNSIIIMGGRVAGNFYNDVWKSTDYGVTWVQQTPAAWNQRARFSSVRMPDNSIIIMGGFGSSSIYNDVWRSVDEGVTWTRINASAGWSPRSGQTSVLIPNSSIIVMGGTDGDFFNDTWSFNPSGSSLQNPIHTYISSGYFDVALQSFNSGRYGSMLKTGYISIAGPLANFNITPNPAQLGTSIVFVDMSSNGPTLWNWSFGDGSISMSQNTTHTYLSIGEFTVRLNTSNIYGFSNVSHNITIYPSTPIANFTIDHNIGTNPLTVQFTDTTTGSGITDWYWNFGDGITSTTPSSVSHQYTSLGTYYSQLTVTSSVGTNVSQPQAIYVVNSAVPIADFTGAPVFGSAPLSVQFTDLSIALSGVNAWNWSFGDGNYSNSQNPVHIYSSFGQYSVTLTTTSGAFSNYTTKLGYINIGISSNTVLADFVAIPLYAASYPQVVQFTDTSVCSPACTNWAWDFNGDGSTDSIAQNPSYNYTYPGNYSPKLIVSNGLNTGTKIRNQYIVIGPIFVAPTITQPTEIWRPSYHNNTTSFSFKGNTYIDVQNSTYLKYWLQNFTATGNFSVYGFALGMMAPIMHVFGFWIFLIVWGLYLFAVWIRLQDVTLPLIIGILTMGTFGLLFPQESLPVIIIMFVICGAIIITKLMKDSI